VEYIPVQDLNSITRAYNKAMYSSKAKYKIYLHQDVFIVEPLFLHHLHNIFLSKGNIGMIGMAGGRWLPRDNEKNLCWTDCPEWYGNVLMPNKLHFQGTLTNKSYEWVSVIDGLLMATQYDIPWREDIIDGFHFYDKSQSLEFYKRGYEVVVPRMENTWVLHLGSQSFTSDYFRLRNKFFKEYSQYLT
jgi:hypothetical protein